VIIVYDISVKETFDHITYWLSEMHKYGNSEIVPFFIIVGNKSDLEVCVAYLFVCLFAR
jgi:GTPase SAR1 family protein